MMGTGREQRKTSLTDLLCCSNPGTWAGLVEAVSQLRLLKESSKLTLNLQSHVSRLRAPASTALFLSRLNLHAASMPLMKRDMFTNEASLLFSLVQCNEAHSM